MDKKMFLAVIGIGALLLATACVTASSLTVTTPLYTFRMEQASNKMNFLPTDITTFTYVTEKGHSLTYATGCRGCGDGEPLVPLTCSTCTSWLSMTMETLWCYSKEMKMEDGATQ